jgi:hypothetical protein
MLAVACAACGGGPRSQTADVLAINQPTPDPTLDAVVRDLPHALAGTPPTPTPTPVPAVLPRPAVKQPAVATQQAVKQAVPTQPAPPAQKPAPPKPTATQPKPAPTPAKPATAPSPTRH